MPNLLCRIIGFLWIWLPFYCDKYRIQMLQSMYYGVATLTLVLLPVATAQWIYAEEVTRKINKLELKTEDHDKVLSNFATTIAQNNLMIQQSITDRRNIKKVQDSIVTDIAEAKGALYLIKWLVLVLTPFITIFQMIQVYFDNKRDKLLHHLIKIQQAQSKMPK